MECKCTRLEIEDKQLMYKKIVTEKTEEKAKFRIARTSYHVTYILACACYVDFDVS